MAVPDEFASHLAVEWFICNVGRNRFPAAASANQTTRGWRFFNVYLMRAAGRGCVNSGIGECEALEEVNGEREILPAGPSK